MMFRWLFYNPKSSITSEDLQRAHSDFLLQDESNRKLNRLYCQHLDEIGAHEAWKSYVTHQHQEANNA